MIPADATHLAGREVAEVAGDGGRADVDRDAVRGVDEAGPHRADPLRRRAPRRSPCARRAASAGCSAASTAGRTSRSVEAPLLGERVEQPAQLAAIGAELGGGHVDEVEAHDRIDHEIVERDRLAHDRPVHLARGGHVDHDVAERRAPSSRAGSPASSGRRPRYVALGAGRAVEVRRARSSIADFGNSPNAGVTMQRPQSARPLHTESRSTPSRRAASSTVVPIGTVPRCPLGVNTTRRVAHAARRSSRLRSASGSQPPLATNRCSRSRGNASSSRLRFRVGRGVRARRRRPGSASDGAPPLADVLAGGLLARDHRGVVDRALEPAGQHDLVLLGARPRVHLRGDVAPRDDDELATAPRHACAC